MAERDVLVELSERLLGVSKSQSESEIRDVFKEKSSEWHPDVSDRSDASEMFVAAKVARDILLDNFDFSDPNAVLTAKNNLSDAFPESEYNEVVRSESGGVSYRGEAETRADPDSYNRMDFAKASPSERQEIMKEVALGVETVIIYRSVENLYEMGYTQEKFFNDVNSYIGEARKDVIDFGDYYQATKDKLRDDISEEFFIESAEKIQDNLQSEYGQGTNIREVARIVAHSMVQGGINIGNIGRFVGMDDTDDDPRFTRNHPLGGHGRGKRGDTRFTRGGDKYERR